MVVSGLFHLRMNGENTRRFVRESLGVDGRVVQVKGGFPIDYNGMIKYFVLFKNGHGEVWRCPRGSRYRRLKHEGYEGVEYELCHAFEYVRRVLGKDTTIGVRPDNNNSMLFQLMRGVWLYVLKEVYEFELEVGEKVLRYYTRTGDGMIPLPVLETDRRVLLMAERVYLRKTDIGGMSAEIQEGIRRGMDVFPYQMYYEKMVGRGKFHKMTVRMINK